MPDPSIMMGAGAAPPAATPPPMPPPGATPGMPPPGGPPPGGPPPGGPRPPQGGGGGNILMLLLSFLAGAGMGDVVKNIKTLMNPGGAGRQHVGGVRMDAAKAPGMTIGPQMMQALGGNPGAQPQAPPGSPPGMPPQGPPQGGPGGGDPKLMMLIQQLMGR